MNAPPRKTLAPCAATWRAVSSSISSPSTEHGPAIITTSSDPIFTPPTSTTVLAARNSRLASLKGLVIGMISWIPLRCENASR